MVLKSIGRVVPFEVEWDLYEWRWPPMVASQEMVMFFTDTAWIGLCALGRLQDKTPLEAISGMKA